MSDPVIPGKKYILEDLQLHCVICERYFFFDEVVAIPVSSRIRSNMMDWNIVSIPDNTDYCEHIFAKPVGLDVSLRRNRN